MSAQRPASTQRRGRLIRRLSRLNAVPVRRTMSEDTPRRRRNVQTSLTFPGVDHAQKGDEWYDLWLLNHINDAQNARTTMVRGFLHPTDCAQDQVLIEVSYRLLPSRIIDLHLMRIRAWIPAPYGSGFDAAPSPLVTLQTHEGYDNLPEWTRGTILRHPLYFREDRGQIAVLFTKIAHSMMYGISSVLQAEMLDWAKLASTGTWAENKGILAGRQSTAKFPWSKVDPDFVLE
ncbi:hypothetical protein K435DRAFT_848161 [Dendrothele bispora CBS 962.96]|uniref:Uncharacterized protein n=1 Tax=Dendrothele bispora (strain CBS 962.96) TaxID=1314807 RepID=A0A4S8MWP6_DENBC|nr:hypothetical protein K435DRAFT_850511 [Dendrothele bispora CBS 962.96]THV07758.1 hypothetical protein K435DRAFT_848161 [Dendrothele bispora CBS 962.96]